jgi:hypothetical protein
MAQDISEKKEMKKVEEEGSQGKLMAEEEELEEVTVTLSES